MSETIRRMSDEEASGRGESEAGFGALATVGGPLPLKAMLVDARVTGLFAETTVRQTFENNLAEPLEASYIFPLPDRAAVTGFRLEVKGRVVEGVIEERGAAREEYQHAVEAGHRAAIAEEERPGVFSLRVGNIPPRESVTVELRLCAQLPFEDGEATFRFPLVVAPRYIPGHPLAGESVGDGTAQDTDAVPDASRISPPVLLPGYPNPVRLQLAVTLDPAGAQISDLRSTLHVVEETRSEALGEGQRYRVALRAGERLDRDFILRFRVGDGVARTSLRLRPDTVGGEGTFLLTCWPPAGLPEGSRPRDVIFVLDRSGSMTGWKIVAARRAVARMVDTLGGVDRFAVYAFDDVIEVPPELGMELCAASDRHRFRAVEFLAQLEARGSTEMAEPLEQAARRLSGGGPERERVLVLVTDGQVGNEDQILRRLAPVLRGTRVFTLGVDREVNEGFLQRLAALGAGACVLTESEDRLDQVMQLLHRRIGAPLITELEVEPTGLELVRGSLVPARLPDLFPGAPLLVTGRYRGAAQGKLRLRGRQAGGAWSCEVIAGASSNAALAAIWARGQIRQLEDRYQVESDSPGALEREIVETSLRFGVLSRFTAFLAVDRSEVVNRGGHGRRVLQPVDAPDGWDLFEECSPAPSGERNFGRYCLGEIAPDGSTVAQTAGAAGFERRISLTSFGPELSGDPALVKVLIEEGKLAAHLTHPWIAQIYDLGLTDGSYYLAAELVWGAAASPLVGHDAAESVAIVGQVLRALVHAHARNVIHGEIGPETVFSTPAGVKVLGFGLGRVRRAIALRDGAPPRQPAFLAPELLAGAPGDPRSDLFGAGALCVFLLTGRPPSRPYAPIAGLPAALAAILERALAPDPAARFGTAEEMLRSLEAAGFRVPPDPVPAPSLTPAPPATSPVPSTSSVSEAPSSLPPLDLAPYRQRLADALPGFDRRIGGPELAKQVRSLLALLGPLADDLHSVGAPAAVVERLREQERALRQGGASVATSSWQRVLAALAALVEETMASPPGRRRWAFWRK